MIHLFNNRKRILFFPIGFANSVARWCLGVHSPSGTINITNTANPSDSGSVALDVNVDALRNIMAGVIEDHDVTGREIKRVKDIVHGTIDGTSLIMGGEHISVSMDWLQQNIQKYMTNGGDDDMTLTHDKITDWDAATADFLTDEDVGVEGGAAAYSHTHSHSNISDWATATSGFLDSSDIGTSVAPNTHSHSEYATTGHNHDARYSLLSHDHSGDYANARHTHAKADLTNFDANVKSNIPSCYQNAPTAYNAGVNSLVMFYASGTVGYGNLGNVFAPKSTDPDGYADAGHTHDEYATSSDVYALSQVVSNINESYADKNDLWSGTTKLFVDTSTNQTVAGQKTFSNNATFKGRIYLDSDVYGTPERTTTLHICSGETWDRGAHAIFNKQGNFSVVSETIGTNGVKTSAYYLTGSNQGRLSWGGTTTDSTSTTDNQLPKLGYINDKFIRKPQETTGTKTVTVVTEVDWSGTQLRKKTRTLTFTDGILTSDGTESGWTGIDNAVTIQWS